jgi:prophage antirepressor-like protein
MEIVKAFNENNLHTNIVIKGTYNEPLFRASDIGEILEMTNIRATVQNFDNSEKVVNSIDTLGGCQNMIFLTEKGLYKVLFKSRKPIAEKFQNWVCEVIKEIRLNGIFDLQKQIEIQKTEMEKLEDKKSQEYELKLEQQKVLEREQILLKEYATIGSIFYIIKIKSLENGSYIIKIGESRRGIKDRYKEHKSKYEECLLLDCFTVYKSKDFETFIKEHELIRFERVKDLKCHETELELFLIGKKLSYQVLLNIINNNIKYFNTNDNSKLELENEKLKLMLEMKNSNNNNLLMDELIKNIKLLSNKVDNIEKQNKEILEKINASQIKVSTGFSQPLVTLGPRLQQIHPGTLQLIKVYESVAECLKESNFVMKRPSIEKAINENIIYNGFRWLYVDRNLDANIIHSINPTKITKAQNLGYIAQINKEQTEIINVYIDRKTAANLNGYESSSALDNSVKNYALTKGFYYKLYDNCDDNLRAEFEEKILGQPLLYKDGVGQFDLQNNLVKEFVCKYDCIKQLKISDKTLTKALDKNMPYNNFLYQKLEPKVKCL